MADQEPGMKGITRDGLDLMAAIVAQNVDNAAYATERMLQSEKAQTRKFAAAYVALYDAVDRAAGFVTTREIENALDYGALTYNEALKVTEGGGES